MHNAEHLKINEDGQLVTSSAYWAPAQLTIAWDELCVHFASERSLQTICSGIHGGGISLRQHILNFNVSKLYNCSNPKADVRERLDARGIAHDEACTLMTSARLADAGWHVVERATYYILVCVSAGFSNAARVTDSIIQPSRPGTINIVSFIAGTLTEDALVGTVITATEAKSAALQDLRVQTSVGRVATGTTTDAIVIGATQNGAALIEYAGLATGFGQDFGSAVYTATMVAGKRYFEYMEKFH